MPDVHRPIAPVSVRLAGDALTARQSQRLLAGRIVAVALVLLLLWVAAATLSRAAHDQRVRRGERAAARAAEALRRGDHAHAVTDLREAVALEPGRPEFRLMLAKALVAAGQPAEAEPYVQEALRQQPVNGEANLVLARILRAAGDVDEAEAAYHRAIYGRWERHALPLRVQARLELVSLFRAAGQRLRLRAALLELSTAFPGDRGLQLQAGRELLADGFADDAARQLRTVVERFADPGDALALLARAEFSRGNYIEAYAAAGRAVARHPDDRESATLRSLAAHVLTLDPDQPRLSRAERVRRVRVLLTQARARLQACLPAASATTSPRVVPLVNRWLSRRQDDAEVGRALLAATATVLADRCPGETPGDAIGIVLRRLAGAGSA